MPVEISLMSKCCSHNFQVIQWLIVLLPRTTNCIAPSNPWYYDSQSEPPILAEYLNILPEADHANVPVQY